MSLAFTVRARQGVAFLLSSSLAWTSAPPALSIPANGGPGDRLSALSAPPAPFPAPSPAPPWADDMREGRLRWRESVETLKRGGSGEELEEAASEAVEYLRANPRSPEVLRTLAGDLEFHQAVSSLGDAGLEAATELKRELAARAASEAASAALHARRWGRAPIFLLAGAGLLTAAAASYWPLLALLSIPVLAGLQWRELNKAAVLTRLYGDARVRQSATQRLNTLSERRYTELVRRELRRREKAGRPDLPGEPEDVRPGDVFEAGLAKLLRRPDPWTRGEAREILEQRLIAELLEARRGPTPERLARLTAGLLLRFPDDGSWRRRRRRITSWSNRRLEARFFMRNGAFLDALGERLDAGRRAKAAFTLALK